MKGKLFVFSTMVLLYLIVVVSCKSDNNIDCGTYDNRFKTIDILISNKRYSNYDSISHSFAAFPAESHVLGKNNFLIEVSPEKETYMAGNSKTDFSLISQAYACSPAPPTTDEIITSINIYADKDFDSNHLKGSTLSDIFDVILFDRYMNAHRMSIEHFVASQPKTPEVLYLVLKAAPANSGAYSFSINYGKMLKGEGQIFYKQSAEVNLE